MIVSLREDDAIMAGHHAALPDRRMDQRVAHEINPATLLGGRDHVAHRSLQALVSTGNDELDTPQATTFFTG